MMMKGKLHLVALGIISISALNSCKEKKAEQPIPLEVKTESNEEKKDFNWVVEKFDDIKVLKYQVPSFEKLNLKQKTYVYYLSKAALSGRDIIWDQNYRHNLEIRNLLEKIYTSYSGNKMTDDWMNFEIYLKKVWFSNGIHHHYSTEKFTPKFSKQFLQKAVDDLKNADLKNRYSTLLEEVIFSKLKDNKRVNKASGIDLIKESANNFYGEDITQAEAEGYYKNLQNKAEDNSKPISYGLNSKLERVNGEIVETVWKSGGMYGAQIDQIIFWLEKAVKVAENKKQADALNLLIEYYKTGDLKTWDAYNIAWVNATEGDIDYIQGFVEVYGDSKSYKGSYESIVQIKDFEASEAMQVLSANVQWFEDNSTIQEEHKKKKVTGVSYKVVEAAMESGDASPSTPIGVNLPNANWIRTEHGSKSVSLGNIVYAYAQASGKGMLNEFCFNKAEIERAEKHGKRGDKLHTALHEVVGHASGKLNPGIGTPKETLKNYSSTLEEARADLVALYYLLDNKMVELGLQESLEVGKAEYDSYIRNGMMTQLQRLKLGDVIEEDHMRNRQLVASWAFEKGEKENVIEKLKKDGKTYFVVKDYKKLRIIFGDLLKEIQRIKSEGDFEAGKALVENYGVQVDQEIHKEVLKRVEKLNIAPYSGFVNPTYKLVTNTDGSLKDVKLNFVNSFSKQMLEYSKEYSFK